jgi:hypothetical protein
MAIRKAETLALLWKKGYEKDEYIPAEHKNM